jgi:Ca2+-binding EF-hand superfamily protein
MHFKNPSTEELKLPFTVTPDDRIMRDRMWPKFDLNNNNLISSSEFDQGLDREFGGSSKNSFPRAVRLRAFEAARNKVPSTAAYSKDYVSRKEFRFLLLYLRKYQEIWTSFNKLDENQDAKISKEEFLRSRGNLESWGVDMSDPNFAWASIDRDGSGRIHFYEFAHWVIKQQIDKDKNALADAEETKNIQIRMPARR